jgi:hypothetical protein
MQITSGTPTVQEVLITQQKNDIDDGTNRMTAVSQLTEISDQEIANYIVDHLSPPDVSLLLQSFDKMKRELKKEYPKGLSKDEFVQYIKLKVATPGYGLETPLYKPPAIPDPLEKSDEKLLEKLLWDKIMSSPTEIKKQIKKTEPLYKRKIIIPKQQKQSEIPTEMYVEPEIKKPSTLSSFASSIMKNITPTENPKTKIPTEEPSTMSSISSIASSLMKTPTKEKEIFKTYVIPGSDSLLKLNKNENTEFIKSLNIYSNKIQDEIKTLNTTDAKTYIKNNNTIPAFIKTKILNIDPLKKHELNQIKQNIKDNISDIHIINYANTKAGPTEGRG